MGKYDIPINILKLQELRDKHPEIELRELRRVLYLVLDAVGEPVRIQKDLLVNTPPMELFMQDDIATNEIILVVGRITPEEPKDEIIEEVV